MLFTGKGDDGNTSLFGCCDQRISKSSAVAEALGAVDEVNSLLGVAKMAANEKVAEILDQIQHDLFIVQAELAGAKKEIVREKIVVLENIIQEIEQELPPIKTFFVAGGTPLAAQLDHARAVARRAERRVVKVSEEREIAAATLAYLNRLSSILYALARLENHKSGINEEPPRY
jgi:cob(I)alamin adenosyltransferase